MSLTKAERNGLIARLRDLERRRYPPEGESKPNDDEDEALREGYDAALKEYGDRLPRVVMGASPFTDAVVRRVFDPFGFDGPWWFKNRDWRVDDPPAPADFKVELGAVSLHGRVPLEATESSIPGPDVPFIVPALMGLPGMAAVVMRLEMATGDHAYPITYWSPERIDRMNLHQRWLEEFLWGEKGGWTVCNSAWDFDLARWIDAGKLYWIEPGDESFTVRGNDSGRACPFIGLPGDRQRQCIGKGGRILAGVPDGQLINPFVGD